MIYISDFPWFMSQFSCTKIADSFGLAYMDKQSQNDSKIVEHYPAYILQSSRRYKFNISFSKYFSHLIKIREFQENNEIS
jgi:hypothetical protein